MFSVGDLNCLDSSHLKGRVFLCLSLGDLKIWLAFLLPPCFYGTRSRLNSVVPFPYPFVG